MMEQVPERRGRSRRGQGAAQFEATNGVEGSGGGREDEEEKVTLKMKVTQQPATGRLT